MSIFKNVKKDKLDKMTTDILELQVKKAEVEIELRNLENIKKVAKEEHSFLMESERKDFERTKKNIQEDMQREKDQLKQQHELKLTEAVTLAKLDSEQQLAKMRIDYERQINELKSKHSSDVSELKSSLAKKYYEDLHAMMTKFNTEGTVTTKFVQEMALGMLGHAPESKVRVITESKSN